MNTNYKYKIFEESDVSKMPPLYKSAFGLNVKLSQVKTKFFHPYQQIRSSFLALTEKNDAASFYGMITQRAIYNAESFFIGQSCDSMTHKLHGGKGLFIKLAEKVYTDLQLKGVNYVFGFPNDTIYNLRIKKLKWQHNENINVFKEKVVTLPLAKLVKKLPVLKPVYTLYAALLLRNGISKNSFFKNSVLGPDIAGILHDEAYFAYKKTSDKFILNIHGCNVWIKLDGFFWVGDFENVSKEKFAVVYKELRRLAAFLGCTSVVFHYQQDTLNDKLLKEYFPVRAQMPMGFIYLNEAVATKTIKFTGSDFDSW